MQKSRRLADDAGQVLQDALDPGEIPALRESFVEPGDSAIPRGIPHLSAHAAQDAVRLGQLPRFDEREGIGDEAACRETQHGAARRWEATSTSRENARRAACGDSFCHTGYKGAN